MANSISAEVWLDERRWDALEVVLEEQGSNIDNKNNHSLRGQENFSSSLSYHAGAAISTGLNVLAYHGTEDSRSLWVPVQSFSSFDLLILLTGRIVVENRVVTPPAANLEFDQLAMTENKEADKSFLLQPFHCG